MDDNIVYLDVETTLDIPPQNVIDGASKAELETVVVVGVQEDGSLYLASSTGHNGEIMWLFECAKHQLMMQGYEDG